MVNEIETLDEINEQKIVDTIRTLSIDMIHEANSGHPGISVQQVLRILALISFGGRRSMAVIIPQ